MANTMKALQTVTVGSGGVSSISFTSIPQTYTDLVVKISARDARAVVASSIVLQINGSTASSGSYRRIYGDGAAAFSDSSTGETTVQSGHSDGNSATASTFGSVEIYIPNYAGTTYNKSFSSDGVAETNGTTTYISMVAGLWANTAAITQITIKPATAVNFLQYSTATLYGVFNADVSLAASTPTIGTATAGNALASVTFTTVSNAASYTMTSTPSSITATGTESPITVSGLSNGTAYTFKVKSNNPFGSSAESAASNSVTPVAPTYDVITGIASSPYVEAWTFSNGFGSKRSAPASLQSSTVAGISFSGDKTAVLCAVDTTPNAIGAYAWSSGWGTKYGNPATLPSGRQLGATFFPNNASAVTGGDGSHLNGYAFSSGFGSKYANPASLPTGGFSVRFGNNGDKLAVNNNSASPYQAVYDFSSGFGSKYSNPSTLPPGATYGTAWTQSDNAILFNTGSSPFVVAYPWSAGFGTKYSNPATGMSGLPGRVSNFNYATNAWVGSGDGTDIINAYAWSSGFGTKYSAPAGLPVSRGENAYFTPNDGAVIWGGQSNGTESNLLAWAWTNGSGFGSKYSDPASLSTAIAYGLDVR